MTHHGKNYETILSDQGRHRLLKQMDVLDTYPIHLYDRLCTIVAGALQVPMVYVSIITQQSQMLKGMFGVPHVWADPAKVPISHSTCKHVVATSQPLIVPDVEAVPMLENNPGTHEINMEAYLGMPLQLYNGMTAGALCAIDHEKRQWSDAEIDAIAEFASIVTLELDLRALKTVDRAYGVQLNHVQQLIHHLLDRLDTGLSLVELVPVIRASRAELGL